MNCCNDHGECTQGKDCPARAECCNSDCEQGRRCPVRYKTGWDRLDNMLNAIAYGATILFAIAAAVIVAWVFWG